MCIVTIPMLYAKISYCACAVDAAPTVHIRIHSEKYITLEYRGQDGRGLARMSPGGFLQRAEGRESLVLQIADRDKFLVRLRRGDRPALIPGRVARHCHCPPRDFEFACQFAGLDVLKHQPIILLSNLYDRLSSNAQFHDNNIFDLR